MGSLERLGDVDLLEREMLRILSLNGWQVEITTPFAGGMIGEPADEAPVGFLLIARCRGIEVRAIGETLADAVRTLVADANRMVMLNRRQVA